MTAAGAQRPPRPAVRRRLAAVAAALACVAGAFAQAKDTEVIYPRTAASAATSAGAAPAASNSTLLLLGAGVAVAGGWYFWRQRQGGAVGGVRADRRLAIAESRPLGNRQYLIVADYDGRKFLLGVCPGRIEMLTPLDPGTPPPPRP